MSVANLPDRLCCVLVRQIGCHGTMISRVCALVSSVHTRSRGAGQAVESNTSAHHHRPPNDRATKGKPCLLKMLLVCTRPWNSGRLRCFLTGREQSHVKLCQTLELSVTNLMLTYPAFAEWLLTINSSLMQPYTRALWSDLGPVSQSCCNHKLQISQNCTHERMLSSSLAQPSV